MLPSVRARSVAGGLAPALFGVVLVLLTLAERAFLRRAGWSAVRRTPVEWPSLLALGRYGWVMIATFVIGGVCGIALASAVWSVAVARGERWVAVLILLMSVAVALEAFRPDSPKWTGAASWHDKVHNDVFPAIPIASLAAAVTASYMAWRGQARLIGVAPGSALLIVMIVGLSLTGVGSIAQLGRDFYFGALLAWVVLVARSTASRPAGDSATPTRSTN